MRVFVDDRGGNEDSAAAARWGGFLIYALSIVEGPEREIPHVAGTAEGMPI
jgi:hypothetical protein